MEKPHAEEQIGGFAPRRRSGRSKSQNLSFEELSLEDAIKIQYPQQEMQSMTTKTPVSILQELLSRRGITPSYELVQIEGAIHEPTFRYRVSFNDKDVPFTAMGAGRSKKEAKHAAAKALIDKMTGVIVSEHAANVTQPITPNGGEDNVPTGNNNYDDKMIGNPIGFLQEMCMARRWPPPTYETEMEVGLPHERQFTIACTILKYRETGKGKSKKIAKRMAAHKMWTRLQDSPLDSNQITQIIDENVNEENRIVLNRYADLKDAHIQVLTDAYSHKVAQFHKTLKSSSGEKLSNLQATCLNNKDTNFVQFLEEIAVEHNFEVTYVDIEEKTYSGRYQCLVQLSTLPVAVCHGSGITSKDAQTSAARNALEYLKIMTLK